MSLIKYQNQYPKVWIIPKEIKFYPKNDTQKSGNNPKGTQKSGNNPKSTQNNATSPYRDICKFPLSRSSRDGTHVDEIHVENKQYTEQIITWEVITLTI